MPEMLFHVRWPDAQETACYSPSLVIRDFLEPGRSYPLDDFLRRSREALGIASERVRARYGFPCSRAMGQLAAIETRAAGFAALPGATVTVVRFDD